MVYLVKLEEISDQKELAAAEKKTSSALLRWVFSRMLPEKNPEELDALLRKEPGGKPYLAGHPFYFNVSHSKGLVVCAAECCPVGVDVERKREFSDRLAERICTPGEKELLSRCENRNNALTQLWTMKESYMKYTGRGFSQGIRGTEFSSLGNSPQLLSGDACFICRELPEFFLTLCTARPVDFRMLRLDLRDLLGSVV